MSKSDAPPPAKPPLTPRSLQALGIAIVATIALLGADLGSKEWASSALSMEHPGTPPAVCETPGRNQRIRTEPFVMIPGYLEMSYAENCGAAFGLLNNAPDTVRIGLFGLAAVAATLILFFMFYQGRGGPWFAYSVPLIVAGAVGNLIDRIRLGYVVDFIRFHLEDGWEYPTFNVADITITVGVAMLVIDGFIQEKKEKERAAETEKAEAAPAPSSGKRGKKKRKRPSAEDADAARES
ncbi:MAG: signal peptidase II [Sandaracinaceae bacterium]